MNEMSLYDRLERQGSELARLKGILKGTFDPDTDFCDADVKLKTLREMLIREGIEL